jgi:hypothetical protein
MRRGTARHERSNLSKKSSGLLPEAEEAARIDQRIARYLADLDATDATENDDADAGAGAPGALQHHAFRSGKHQCVGRSVFEIAVFPVVSFFPGDFRTVNEMKKTAEENRKLGSYYLDIRSLHSVRLGPRSLPCRPDMAYRDPTAWLG